MGIDIVKKPCNNLLVVMLSKHGLKFQSAKSNNFFQKDLHHVC